VQAVFSQGGVTGNVLFVQENPGDPVKIHVNLMGLDQSSVNYRWSIREFPVRTSLIRDFPCAEEKIGGIFSPDGSNIGDLTTRLGPLRFDMPWQVFEDPSISLSGPDSIIGRPLVIDRMDGPEGAFICSNFEQLGVRREILRAAFDNPLLQGDVIFRYSIGRDDVLIEADLNRLNSSLSTTGHTWTLNHGPPGPNNTCNVDVSQFILC
jgi:hypothetical protein